MVSASTRPVLYSVSMKHSDNKYKNLTPGWCIATAALLWLLPALLVLPNIWLDYTEVAYSSVEKAVNVLLPLGVYCIIMSLWRNTGATVLLLFPLMFLCSFQIVLLCLYGESVIAIDMFLNVVTTNSSEAAELLENLWAAVLAVCALYLPAEALAAVMVVKKIFTPRAVRIPIGVAGCVIALAGVVCVVCGAVSPGGYRAERRLFPVNAISNMFTAVERTELAEAYKDTSRDFSFQPCTVRPADGPEVYVMVIGETSRAGNWQLNGYSRPPNPRLARRHGMVTCHRALSESNTTHKSVPLMMSHLTASEFGDSIYRCKSIIDAFREAGFSTAWFSNQKRNHSLIDFFGEEASVCEFLTDDGKYHYDTELCGRLKSFLDHNCGRRCFVVLHTYGSHFDYKERYPQEYNCFTPDNSMRANKENRTGLVNAYDNSIRYADAVIDSIISVVASKNVPAALVYAADHGEDIFDDARGRFLHASPTPTYYQMHVPMLVWMSDAYRACRPEAFDALLVNSGKNVSTSRSVFHTLLSLAGVSSHVFDPSAALTSPQYTEPARVYLDDYNEAVPLAQSGLREPDFIALKNARISAR